MDPKKPSDIVPGGFAENLVFRRNLIRRAAADESLQRDLRTACRLDPIFYINTFCWGYNPRGPQRQSKIQPFILFDCQRDLVLDLVSAIPGEDRLIVKARDMGVTFLCLFVFEWLWKFYEYQSFLVASWKEELVDKPGNPKSLFWKIDLQHRYQPSWLNPTIERGVHRTYMHLENPETHSVFDGESSVANMARGDRRTAILNDEYASWPDAYRIDYAQADATHCRIWPSTPSGPAGAFYDHYLNPAIKKMRMPWHLHPEKARGLYRNAAGKLRSPAYDKQLARTSERQMAIEWECDFQGASHRFYHETLLERINVEDVQPPITRAAVDFSPEGRFLEAHDDPDGALLLWMVVAGRKPGPSPAPYAIGADISVGTGSSNSCLSIVNRVTGEKVGEYATPRIDPTEFARLAVALAAWFHDAFLIWEANGAGIGFGREVIRLGHRNLYYRVQEDRLVPGATDRPGWFNTPSAAFLLHSAYRTALMEKRFVNRSFDAVTELRDYCYIGDGQVRHAGSEASDDPTGAKSAHGDRVIADALACMACDRHATMSMAEPEPVVSPYSYQGRRREWERCRDESKQRW